MLSFFSNKAESFYKRTPHPSPETSKIQGFACIKKLYKCFGSDSTSIREHSQLYQHELNEEFPTPDNKKCNYSKSILEFFKFRLCKYTKKWITVVQQIPDWLRLVTLYSLAKWCDMNTLNYSWYLIKVFRRYSLIYTELVKQSLNIIIW